MFLHQMEEMLLTSRTATSHSLRENKGGPYYLPGLISFRHLIFLSCAEYRHVKAFSALIHVFKLQDLAIKAFDIFHIVSLKALHCIVLYNSKIRAI